MQENDTLTFEGKGTLKAWVKGALPYLAGYGYTLPECQEIAEETGLLVYIDEQRNLIVTGKQPLYQYVADI
jgi:hypothetical protein